MSSQLGHSISSLIKILHINIINMQFKNHQKDSSLRQIKYWTNQVLELKKNWADLKST